jgi:sigma-B regulation protein RsbU (phosphoserine phosphatase)
MGAGDIFVAISDGIFEAMDPQGNEFGIERVVDLITRQHHSAAAQLLHAIRQAVATFVRGVPAADDCTVLIIKCTAD